jgi:hypothetical protein
VQATERTKYGEAQRISMMDRRIPTDEVLAQSAVQDPAMRVDWHPDTEISLRRRNSCDRFSFALARIPLAIGFIACAAGRG